MVFKDIGFLEGLIIVSRKARLPCHGKGLGNLELSNFETKSEGALDVLWEFPVKWLEIPLDMLFVVSEGAGPANPITVFSHRKTLKSFSQAHGSPGLPMELMAAHESQKSPGQRRDGPKGPHPAAFGLVAFPQPFPGPPFVSFVVTNSVRMGRSFCASPYIPQTTHQGGQIRSREAQGGSWRLMETKKGSREAREGPGTPRKAPGASCKPREAQEASGKLTEAREPQEGAGRLNGAQRALERAF